MPTPKPAGESAPVNALTRTRTLSITPSFRRLLEQGDASAREHANELNPGEIYWRDHQPWLKQRGYLLRKRYDPAWTPSWVGTTHTKWDVEDGVHIMRGQILDATRLSDGEMVALKRIRRKVHPHEVDISKMFSEEPLRSNLRNHCVPVLEVLDVPDEDEHSILVLPLLRQANDPRFKTRGEALEFFRQVFEGLQFMHECHVAHRDCMLLNVMMDPRPIYPEMYHPQAIDQSRDWYGWADHYTRTARPVKYYLIDFGLSRKYDANDTAPREYPIWGGDKTVPEFQKSDEPCDPFPTDIYYLGNMIREYFLQKLKGFDFMEPLINDMVQPEPALRPTIDEVVTRFKALCDSLPWWAMRSRIRRGKESAGLRAISSVRHSFRAVSFILRARSAMPRPPEHPLHTFTT